MDRSGSGSSENRPGISITSNPTSAFSSWVSKSVKLLKNKTRVPDRVVCSQRFNFDGMVVNNSLYCVSPNYIISPKMEALSSNENGGKRGESSYKSPNSRVLIEDESAESSWSSEFLASEVTLNYEISSSEGSSSSPSLGWPLQKSKLSRCESCNSDKKQGSCLSETEMMKERFSKLLLGEDMSGSGSGVCTALAISNAVTNLYATLFGQVWRLEPLPVEKKLMWRREIQCLLCVSDHIVELIPSWQTFPDGSKLEIMTSRPRSDLYINLPALRKLDNMLLDVLDSFENSEFWYVDQGILAPESDGSSSFRKLLPRQEDKWWLPVPRVPPGGLSEDAKKMLQHKRDCTNQILKAAKAINNAALAEMGIPNLYLESLPKNGKASLGDVIYRYVNSEQFSPECLLDFLDLNSEHHALEIANRAEAAVHVWRRKMGSKPSLRTHRSGSKSSWEIVKDMVSDADKREVLADRADSLLLCLKQRFPGLPQTTLDMSKIQYNKDVGKSILESYSRVLESLAFNIVARIDDLLYVDDMATHSDQPVSISKIGTIKHDSTGPGGPFSSTPYKTAFTTPSFSPLHLISPVRSERSPYMTGLGPKRRIDIKGKASSPAGESSRNLSAFGPKTDLKGKASSPPGESSRRLREAISIPMDEADEDED